MYRYGSLRLIAFLATPLLLLVCACGSLIAPNATVTPIPPTATPAPPTPTPLPPRIELGTLPSTYKQDSLAFSDDGTQYAYVVKVAGGEQLMLDGQPGAKFSQIATPYFSPVTHRLYYWALDSSSGKQLVVLVADGQVVPGDFTSEGTLVFSKDGKHWAAYAGIPTSSGGRAAASVGILADGKEVGRYADATVPAFSPDGSHLAFLAQGGDSRISLLVDGTAQKTYESPAVKAAPVVTTAAPGSLSGPFSVRYLSDGSLVILTQDQNGWTVYKNDAPISSYPHSIWASAQRTSLTYQGFETSASILARSINTAESAPLAVWWEQIAGDARQWHVVRDGQSVDSVLCASYWSDQLPVVSADGQHFAYPCRTAAPEVRNTEILAVVDGKKYGPFDHIWGITLSSKGEHSAFASQVGQKWSYFRDGQAYSLVYDSPWPPVLSADGSHVAWSAKRDAKIVLALDGQEVGSSDANLWGPRFDQSGSVSWIAKEGNTLVRLTFR